MRKILWLVGVVAVVAIGLLLFRNFSPRDVKELAKKTPPGVSKIDQDKILSGGPRKDGIPSIDKPKFWTADRASSFLKDNDVVLGLELFDESRAYPLRILNWHEIVNDTVGAQPVLITYCPLCYTGIAFKREVDGKPVEFGVSGKLYNNNLLMYNRPNSGIREENLWSQLLGEAVVGPLTGKKLEPITLDTVTWGDWKKKHPNTKVLSTDTGHSRDYERNPYGNYESERDIIFPVTKRDDRLHPKAKIYGIELNGKFKAYPQDALKKGTSLTDSFSQETIKISVNDIGQIRLMKENGQPLPWTISFWFSWVAFHPDTELYSWK